MQVKELIDILKGLPEEADVHFAFRDERIDPDNFGCSIFSVLYLAERNGQIIKSPAVVMRGE